MNIQSISENTLSFTSILLCDNICRLILSAKHKILAVTYICFESNGVLQEFIVLVKAYRKAFNLVGKNNLLQFLFFILFSNQEALTFFFCRSIH